MIYHTSDTFAIQQPFEAVVGSVSLPVHRFSVATGDSTTTRTRCWQFYFSGSRPEMCGTCILCFPLNGSKRIIEYHRRSSMYWKRKPTFQGLWPHRSRHRSVPPGDLGSYDLECGLSFPTSHPSTLGVGWGIIRSSSQTRLQSEAVQKRTLLYLIVLGRGQCVQSLRPRVTNY